MNNNVSTEKTVTKGVRDITSLASTVELMNSEDPKERFIAEYAQTKIRYDALHKLIVKKEAGTLDPEFKTPLLTLNNQASFMGQYLKQLEIRAELENIELPKI